MECCCGDPELVFLLKGDRSGCTREGLQHNNAFLLHSEWLIASQGTVDMGADALRAPHSPHGLAPPGKPGFLRVFSERLYVFE